MSKVYFSKELNNLFLKTFEIELKKKFSNAKNIAIKIHFGEEGNKTAFIPDEIKLFTDSLKKIGYNFFLYDSSTAYNGVRNNPERHRVHAINKGFGKLGEIRTDDNYIDSRGKYMDYEVCKSLVDADAVLIISHFKGHAQSGFGGAIKNLGMGALTKKSKSDIHNGGRPLILDNCNRCGACEKACSFGFLKITNDEHVFSDCYGCSKCIISCPNRAMKPKIALFDSLLADGANTAQLNFKNYFYLNIAKKITRDCDCENDSRETISEDIGYFFGEDAVSIDQACLNKIIEKSGNIFKKFNQKSGQEQLEAAENLRMGIREFELIDLNYQ